MAITYPAAYSNMSKIKTIWRILENLKVDAQPKSCGQPRHPQYNGTFAKSALVMRAELVEDACDFLRVGLPMRCPAPLLHGGDQNIGGESVCA